jgi:hypothetical protein
MALWAASLVMGCQADVKLATWQPVDVGQFNRAMTNPTGKFALETIEELMANDPLRYADIIDKVGRSLEVIEETIRPAAGEGWSVPPVAVGGTIRSTNAFLKFSCPGEDLDDAVTDFSAGSIRLDTPLAIDSASLDFAVTGDILLTFDSCRTSTLLFQGRARAYYDPAAELMAAYCEILVSPPDAREPPLAFSPLLGLRQGLVEVLIGQGETGSFRISATGESSSSFAVATADAVYACTLDLDELSCTEKHAAK